MYLENGTTPKLTVYDSFFCKLAEALPFLRSQYDARVNQDLRGEADSKFHFSVQVAPTPTA